MALNKVKLGDVVIPYSKKCGIPNLTPYQVSGVNREKEFFEPSHQIGTDTSKYQEVPPNFFACNLMHVGRDKVLPIAYNHTNVIKIVSPAYSVFSIKKDSPIIEQYFFLMLKSDERDRFFWFNTDSSIRDGMSWQDFCEVEIELPDLATQQKYVDIYLSVVANQQSYERGLDDLKLTCDGYIENLRRNMPGEPIGQYIEETREKNENKLFLPNKAVSNSKIFVDAKEAVFNGVDTRNYLIVHKGEFAYNTVTTRNADKLSLAFNNEEDCLVSPLYTTFKVKKDKLLPEYLCLWLIRDEYDRYARFHSWGSARELYSFETLAETKIPIPDIKVQQAIADIYKVYTERKEINEKLKAQIKDICPILIKGSLNEGR